MKLFIILILFPLVSSINVTNFLKPNPDFFGDDMQKFIRTIINQTYNEYTGYLFAIVNDIDNDCIDYCLKHLSERSSGVVLNMGIKANPDEWVKWMDDTHFKFILVNPKSDVVTTQKIFVRLRNIRTKTAIIFTRTLPMWMVKFTLHMYSAVKSLNVITVHEENGVAEVYTTNTFKRKSRARLTDKKFEMDLFEDKARHVFGYTIKALLTNQDESKVVERMSENGTIEYTGKDVETIRMVCKHIGGNLEIINVNDLVENEENPWNPLIVMENRDEMKKNIVITNDISLLIKSERFKAYDPIFEQVYPHTMNNLRVVVPKADMLTVFSQFLQGFSKASKTFCLICPLSM